jgi:hypothetical protein
MPSYIESGQQIRIKLQNPDHANKHRARLRPNMRMQPDRFAREIGAILTLTCAARSRRLMRSALGGHERTMG